MFCFLQASSISGCASAYLLSLESRAQARALVSERSSTGRRLHAQRQARRCGARATQGPLPRRGLWGRGSLALSARLPVRCQHRLPVRRARQDQPSRRRGRCSVFVLGLAEGHAPEASLLLPSLPREAPLCSSLQLWRSTHPLVWLCACAI